MPRCPNCGRETLRTEDWACQWCGHPLLYGPFKKIEKTHKQLKEERLNKSKGETGHIQEREQEPESERKMEPKQDLELIKGIELEPEPEIGKEAAVAQGIEQETETEEETEPVKEPERELKKIEESESELEAEPTQEAETEKEVGAGPEEEGKPEPEEVEEPETEETKESEPETEPKTEKETELVQEPEPEPKPEPADMELTVGEILTAYEEDDVAADEKFMNKVLRVTGTVSLIDIKDKLDIHYIRLKGSGGDPWQSLQCMFDKKHSQALEQLEKGQTVTVQGRYSGSVIAIRMVDCVLVF